MIDRHVWEIITFLADNDWWEKNAPTVGGNGVPELVQARIDYYFNEVEPKWITNFPNYTRMIVQKIYSVYTPLLEKA
jgi:hypothetical protein